MAPRNPGTAYPSKEEKPQATHRVTWCQNHSREMWALRQLRIRDRLGVLAQETPQADLSPYPNIPATYRYTLDRVVENTGLGRLTHN